VVTRKRTSTRTPGVVGYCRVSTEEQAISGLGLAAQEQAIRAECERRGLVLLALHTDAGISGKSLDRPGLSAALRQLDDGEGDMLMAAKLDRLSRSVRDVVELLEHSVKAGWRVLTLDLAIDTTTPFGEAMVSVSAAFSQLERRLIGERTKAALAVKRAEGARLGRQSVVPDAVMHRVLARRDDGASYSAIARELNDDEVPTTYGGRAWYPSTVRNLVLAHAETASVTTGEAVISRSKWVTT
jgi:DNA invertase Pin-like site-specific DNA recombinase